MKRGLLTVPVFIVIYVLFLLSFRESAAVVSGDCDACHGLFPGLLDETVSSECITTNVLCIICHSSDSREPVKILGRSRVPVVFSTTPPGRSLAGGNFHYVGGVLGDRKGHNVGGIAPIDEKFTGYPPGYNSATDPSLIGYNHKEPLNCAGSNGCHGNRNIKSPFSAIRGSHHATDKPVDGSTTSRSYRYLKITDKVRGVTGLEDSDWGIDGSAGRHNEYSTSIDDFCAGCHGEFHRNGGSERTGPWFRHPTGIVLPGSGEYAFYNPEVTPSPGTNDIRIYRTDAPVGRTKVPAAPSNEVRPGEDVVICMSCHMAHSSPYESILRWDYDNIYAHEEGKGGCLICHTGKK